MRNLYSSQASHLKILKELQAMMRVVRRNLKAFLQSGRFCFAVAGTEEDMFLRLVFAESLTCDINTAIQQDASSVTKARCHRAFASLRDDSVDGT